MENIHIDFEVNTLREVYFIMIHTSKTLYFLSLLQTNTVVHTYINKLNDFSNLCSFKQSAAEKQHSKI